MAQSVTERLSGNVYKCGHVYPVPDGAPNTWYLIELEMYKQCPMHDFRYADHDQKR